jgi:hypothetical protein
MRRFLAMTAVLLVVAALALAGTAGFPWQLPIP